MVHLLNVFTFIGIGVNTFNLLQPCILMYITTNIFNVLDISHHAICQDVKSNNVILMSNSCAQK